MIRVRTNLSVNGRVFSLLRPLGAESWETCFSVSCFVLEIGGSTGMTPKVLVTLKLKALTSHEVWLIVLMFYFAFMSGTESECEQRLHKGVNAAPTYRLSDLTARRRVGHRLSRHPAKLWALKTNLSGFTQDRLVDYHRQDVESVMPNRHNLNVCGRSERISTRRDKAVILN